MSINDIKALTERKPFRVFIINMIDGKSLVISTGTEVLFPTSRPELVISMVANINSRQAQSLL